MRNVTTIYRTAFVALVVCACLPWFLAAQEVDDRGNPLRDQNGSETLRDRPVSTGPRSKVAERKPGLEDSDGNKSAPSDRPRRDQTIEKSVQSFQSAFMRAYGEITPDSKAAAQQRTPNVLVDQPAARVASLPPIQSRASASITESSAPQDRSSDNIDSTVFLMNSSSLVLPRNEPPTTLKDLPELNSGPNTAHQQSDADRQNNQLETATRVQHPIDRKWAIDPVKNSDNKSPSSFETDGSVSLPPSDTTQQPRVAQVQDESFPQHFPDDPDGGWNPSQDPYSVDSNVITDTNVAGEVNQLPAFNDEEAYDRERTDTYPHAETSQFAGDQNNTSSESLEATELAAPDAADENTFRLPSNQQDFPVLTDPEPTLPLSQSSTTKVSPNSAIVAKPTFGAGEDMGKFWWKEQVSRALHSENQTELTNPNLLIYDALKNSPRIRAISQEPLLRELQVIEAESAFDPNVYLQSQFDDRVDPVGNTLTTGGAPFLLDHIFSGEAGVRRKLVTGGELDLGQRIGFQNSNSRFFVPQDQGTATLALNFSQPLLRGRGRYYNQSQILIAQSTGGVAWSAFQTQLQDELERVVKAYWRLYYDRSVFLQKRRNVLRGEKILALLEGRRDLDSLPSQIARARSSVSSRKAELANAFRDVRNAETEIRRRIADPNWLANQQIELLPVESAQKTENTRSLEQIVHTALDNRPEIREAMQRAKIAAVQYDVSTNELLPELSLLLNTYVSALEGDSGIEVALTRQFSTTPGYSVGLNFEFPINNRAARSRMQQRHVQKVKIQADLDASIQTVIAESQIANRGLVSALQTMDAAEDAIDAAQMDLVQNRRRWDAFAFVNGDIADGQTPTTILDQLLDSQDRLASAELVYAQAELELKLAEIELQRAMGTLLISKQIGYSKTTGLGQHPEMILDMDAVQGEPSDGSTHTLPQPTYDSIRN